MPQNYAKSFKHCPLPKCSRTRSEGVVVGVEVGVGVVVVVVGKECSLQVSLMPKVELHPVFEWRHCSSLNSFPVQLTSV